MNKLNEIFLKDFTEPIGIIAGAMLYKLDIDPEDANGEDNVFAQITIKPNTINIFIKQLVDIPGESPMYIRRNHVVIPHEEYLGDAIHLATLESFIDD